MGAFTQDQRLVPEDCNLCMDCVVDCPREVARFSLRKRRRKVPAAVAAPSSRSPSSPDQPVPQESRSPKAPHTGFAGLQMSRRAFVGAVGAGVAVPLVLHAARTGMHSPPDEHFLRPPGAQDETRLLDLCVRCGQCMKVCPNNALQPSLLQGGIEGMFVPHLVPRIGYCEYDCTLCGQVCPTGAIPNLIQQQKHKAIIGKAVLNQDLCLPWAENQECICCEEHCPVDEKAIQYDVVDVTDATGQRVTIQRPYVIVERCVGCGICENVCPVDGEAAIRVQREQTVTAEDSGRGRMIRRRFRGGRGA
jgi:ferredoxin